MMLVLLWRMWDAAHLPNVFAEIQLLIVSSVPPTEHLLCQKCDRESF